MSSSGIDLGARWFAGKSRSVAGVRPAGGAGGLALLDVRYADGGAERYLDVPDGFAWGALLGRLGAGTLPGERGALELRRGPALPARIGGAQREPSTDQSNTLVVLGERLLVKAYRRLQPGVHPEVELLAALAGRDAPVPAFAGSLQWIADDGAPDTAIALLQEFVPGAEDGWEAPIERAAAALRAGPPYDVAEWESAGRVAARLHGALADAFGLVPATTADLAAWHDDAVAALAEASRHDAELAAWAPRIRWRLSALPALAPPPLTRIHGDLHTGQLLRHIEGSDPLSEVDSDPLVIDFEGDPLRPLADRRRPDTPLRDLAAFLRCVDHIGSAGSRRAGDADPRAWIGHARAAVLAAYQRDAPVPVDEQLLVALELAKECAEYVYAQRVAPEWLYAPQCGMRRLLD